MKLALKRLREGAFKELVCTGYRLRTFICLSTSMFQSSSYILHVSGDTLQQ